VEHSPASGENLAPASPALCPRVFSTFALALAQFLISVIALI
jgi:hypothetical protein